jgi:NAD+ kinase
MLEAITMKSKFRHIALIGKHQPPVAGGMQLSSRQVLDKLAHFLHTEGCEVVVEKETCANAGMQGYAALDVAQIGRECDLAVVVGGDGTMLGFGRKLAPHGVPLIGINQGRLGFITDIPLNQIEEVLRPMLRGQYEVDDRSLMHGKVWRDGHCVFEALAMNDVVVNRGSTAGMVELRVEVDGHFVARQRADGLIIATPTGSTAYALSAWVPSLPTPCPIAPWSWLTRARSPLSWWLATPAPTLTCNRWLPCWSGTASVCAGPNITPGFCTQWGGATLTP